MAHSLVTGSALRVAVAGNPNCGKTTLFNRLTGLRQKVGNYPGVTVERKEGSCLLDGQRVDLLDLPGSYSLTVQSPDEEVARDVLFDWQPDCPPPDVVLVVVDACNLERNLFLATQMLELGYPSVLALNMIDMANERGTTIDVAQLEASLGVPVVPTVATTGRGMTELQDALLHARPSSRRAPLKPAVADEVERLAGLLRQRHRVATAQAPAIALRLLGAPGGIDDAHRRYGPEFADDVDASRRMLAEHGVVWQGCEASTRYAWLRQIAAESVRSLPTEHAVTTSDRIDRVLTHRFWGPLLFALVMALVFQSIYTWAAPFMERIDGATNALKSLTKAHLPAGVLTDLLSDGVLTGVGAVMVFLPQILFLFFFLTLLEETGYMSRAAFVMDRVMSKVGLHGRSFVPLLSSFACAIPGIMAARTIASRRDRLATILVAPLMTCSARLPVYALLIGAFVPKRPLLGGLVGTQGLALLSLYLLGVVSALLVAFVLKRTILRGPTPALLLELPPYRMPNWANVARELWSRAFLFLRFAGSIILSMSILLWFLAAFPKLNLPEATVRQMAAAQVDQQPLPADTTRDAALAQAAERVRGQQQLEHSFLGRGGRLVAPLVRPLGFDWQIGIGLISAFAAREVMVSTLGVIFAVGDEANEHDSTLAGRLRAATWPDGRPLFTLATVCSLLVFFVYAMQCMSTIGVVVRETGGWQWARFMILYMTVLAWSLSFLTYQGLCLAGLG